MAGHPRLYRRGRVYYVRAKVPADLQAAYAPKREVTYSLRTSDRKPALERVRIEAVKIDQEFAAERRRQQSETNAELSEQDIQRLAALYLHQELAEDEEQRVTGDESDELYRNVKRQLDAKGYTNAANFTDREAHAEFGLSQRAWRHRQDAVRINSEALRSALSQGDGTIVQDEVDLLLERQGIRLQRTSQSYKRLCYEVLKAAVKATDRIEQRQQGEPVETPHEPDAPAETAEPAPVALSQGQSPTVWRLWDLYKDEHRPADKTVSDFKTYVRRFVEINGDLPADQIQPHHIRDFKDTMLKVPNRLDHQTRELPVTEIVEKYRDDDETPRLNARTINDKALGAISAVLGYAVTNGYMASNPASGLKARSRSSREPSRVPYSVSDLQTIFNSPIFTEGHRPKGGAGEAAKWLPLLALFSGARVDELGRLRVSDIQHEDGVAFMFFRDQEKKELKSASSRRKVPIHPRLLDAGFLEYLSDTQKAGNEMLFPKLKSKRTQATASFSQWWSRYTSRLGIKDGRKVFHSFRHTAKREMREQGLDKWLQDALLGHSSADVGEQYGLDEEGVGVSLPVLFSAVSKLEFRGLDLSHLEGRRSIAA